MPIFLKDSLGLVCDLINQSNVNLPFPVVPAIVNIGKPLVIPTVGESISNTEVLLSALPTGPYYGSKRVKYRRIDLSKLLKGMSIEVRKWAPGLASAQVFRVSDLLLDINARWGLKLAKDDLADDPWIIPHTDNYYPERTSLNTITIAATSKAYIGSFQLRWVNGERDMADLLPVMEITGREFPGGNVFDSLHKEILNTVTYRLDITPVVVGHNVSFFKTGVRIQGSFDAHKDLVNFINVQCGTAYTFDVDNIGLPGNLYNALITAYDLPAQAALIPEANATYYNKVLAIIPTQAQQDLWCAGKMILHFNE